MNERQLENDEALASLMAALADQYRKQISEQEIPKNDVRLDVVRKLTLIGDSIKGLMKPRQRDMGI